MALNDKINDNVDLMFAPKASEPVAALQKLISYAVITWMPHTQLRYIAGREEIPTHLKPGYRVMTEEPEVREALSRLNSNHIQDVEKSILYFQP
jgi:hypothetical protein